MDALDVRSPSAAVLEIFERHGAYRRGGHFRLASGLHAEEYVDFGELVVRASPDEFALLGRAVADAITTAGLAARFLCVPSGDAEVLARETARALPRRPEAIIVARKLSRAVFALGDLDGALIRGRPILLLDDVVSTGSTLDKLERLVQVAGGLVVGRAVLWARDDQFPIIAPVHRKIEAWPPGPQHCPRCQAQVPIDPTVGHGAEEVLL